MFEIWRHRGTGERFLVAYHFGIANAAAGPLRPGEDPPKVLETRSNQNHNVQALLEMRAHPEDYEREYGKDKSGKAVRLASH